MNRPLLIFLLICFLIPGGFAQTNEEQPYPDTVKIGSYIISIHDINFHNKEYTVRFWLWLLYDNPGFDFAKQIDIPNAKHIEEPEVIMDMVEGKMWQLMKMKCTMKQNWKVGDFPFDKQHLVVHIENTIYDQNKLVFVPDQLGSAYDRELTLDGWHISNFEVNTNTHEYTTVFGDPSTDMLHSEYASFNIVVDIEREAWGLFTKIFIGMYIAFMIAVLSFTPHPSELEPRFGLPVGGLFAAVGNKYIIDSLLPESSSFSLVDTLHTITFLAIFATLFISAVSLRLYDRNKTALSEVVSRMGSWIIICLYIILNLIFIGMAM
jgi:hypothetical protein